VRFRAGLPLLLLLAAARAAAQEPAPPEPVRPPEGSIIINLPSADVPKAGTLTLFITHRFSQPVEDSDFHSLFSFDSAADIKIGLAYSPLPNLEISLGRDPAHCFCGQGGFSSSAQPQGLEIYELGAKYHLWTLGPLGLSLRLGEDWRTAQGLENRNTFFAQSIVALSIGSRVRITAVPTYVSKTSGQPQFKFGPAFPPHSDIFNVPLAISLGVTRSVYIHGEVVPKTTDPVAVALVCPPSVKTPCGYGGVGWIASLEKTVLRHRFAFTVGNLRATTVDQYIASDFRASEQQQAFKPHNYFLGFNIIRQWNLK
jgi:hypothetical protein